MTSTPETASGAILLVHGAWVGEWCWEPLKRALHDSRHHVHGVGTVPTVHAVSLTGHGARAAESGPHITLDTHADDVTAAIEHHDLHDVTLVGHSYGGRVITRAWRRVADRVGALVYVDAHAPIGPGTRTDRAADCQAEAEMVPFRDFHPTADLLGGEEAVDAFYAGLMPQSARTLHAPFFEALPDDLPRTYVAATAEPDRRFRPYAAAAAADTRWHYVELDATHWLILTHAEAVARIVLEAGATRWRSS
ncbi:alpha/beta fold hydrolase [Desertimonas flava]|uniref:alpha/beta fold hydrolase n=1 Tax=Desertimonas flava TaxID=2064846 RepID=UPI0013C3F2E2|nr:alpha/beta hydrolase [Desertimonas flava]